jgi:phosphotriesterase-related protein
MQSGINVVAATGCWMDPPRSFYRRAPDEIAPLFIRELTDGIAGTSVRAGVIKVASEGPMSPQFRVIFEAAGIAGRHTDAPIYTHSSSATRDGLTQLDVLIEAGADPQRICIGHSNDTGDIGYLTALASRGCFIGLDRFPGDHGLDLQQRIDLLATLVEAGLADNILLSHDWAVEYSHSVRPRPGRERNPEGYRLIPDTVLVGAADAGVSPEMIQRICHDNPRRFLTGEKR